MGFREMRGGDGVSDVEIRRNEIIELLYTYKKYSIDDFAKRFGVSRRTINYDIVYLIEQQIRERKQQLSRNDMSNTSEKILQKTRLIQKKLSSTPPLELFDESVFKELVKKVLISNTAIQFELINGMKLSESRAAT